MKEDLLKEISDFKTVLENMPTNNIKNRTNKEKVILEEKENKQQLLNKVETKLKIFKESFSSLKPNGKIDNINKSLETCKFLNEWNKYNTAYEKMHLDYYLYLLSHYYKEDLKTVNEWLLTIFKAFKTVGLNITYENFNYNTYAKKYIKTLLEAKEDTKKIFDEVYWQCPNLIKTIEVNIKGIYLANESKIERYYQERHNKYLETHQEADLINLRKELVKEHNDIHNRDTYYLIDNFVTKKWSISDYAPNSIEKLVTKYFGNNNNLEEIGKLKQTLLEYNLIVKYMTLLEDMKNKISNKDTYKSKKNTLQKEINKLEKEIIKLNHNKNETKIGLFKSKKKDDKLLFKYNESLEKLSTNYDTYDEEIFNIRISNSLTLDTTILEVFKFITSNFLYFVSERKKEDDNLTINILNEEYIDLQNIINQDNFIFINHIALLDEQNLKMIIADKYKLENINLEITSLEDDNLENTIKEVDILYNYYNLGKANLNYTNILSYLTILNMDI